MSWIPTRPRALAITTLTAALLLTALPAGAVGALSSSQLTSEPGPAAAGAPILVDVDTAPAATAAELTVAELITAQLSAAAPTAAARIQATSIAPAMGAEGPHAGARAGTGGHATKTNSSTQSVRVSASSVVIAFARSHLRARYRSSATGPTSFDCSGLMWRVFKEAGLSAKVVSQNTRSIYQSYRARGLASRQHPQVGDLVVWGGGSHIGVYIGGGNAISALTNGVRVHRVRAMLTPFTAYLHTNLASVAKPAWELQVATHMRTLRHATRTVFLRAEASGRSASVGSLRSGTRFVVLARRNDGAGRLWLRAMTLTGRVGWIPSVASAR